MKSLSSGTPRARLLSHALSFHFDAHTCRGTARGDEAACGHQSPTVSTASS